MKIFGLCTIGSYLEFYHSQGLLGISLRRDSRSEASWPWTIPRGDQAFDQGGGLAVE
jgi:hypothetical protein